MVNIGIVGIGFMGVTHYKAVDGVRGGKVTAIATRDPKKRKGDWRSIQGNFGGSGGVQDLGRITCYESMDELLADPKVDLVDICLPTTMHTEASLRALQAGKHVLLEKPIALDLREADRIIAEAKRCKRQFMVAHVLRFFPEFLLIKKLIEGGELGGVQVARFKRIISRPTWWDPQEMDRSWGPAIDLHIHDVDFIQYLFGLPKSVVADGYVGKEGNIDHVDTHYDYGAKGPMVSAEGGWLAQQGCPFEHGYDIYFEDATLKFNSSWGVPPQLLTRDGKVRRPRLPGKDGFVGELQEAVDAIRSGKPSKIIGGESARNSLAICLKEIQSVRKGRKVAIR